MYLASRCKRFDGAAEHHIGNTVSDLLQIPDIGTYRLMEKRPRRGTRRDLLELRNRIDFLAQRPLREFLEFGISGKAEMIGEADNGGRADLHRVAHARRRRKGQ